MKREKLKLVLYFCLGLTIGFLFNFNIASSENTQEAKNMIVTEELVKMNMKLDTVLANQALMTKELKRIFGRIH
jgi:hypothetical protein